MQELFHCFGICGEPHPSVVSVIVGSNEANIYIKTFYDYAHEHIRNIVNRFRSAQQ